MTVPARWETIDAILGAGREMRKGVVAGVVGMTAVVLVAGAWLGWQLAMAGPGGCAAALLQGTLVPHEGTLAVRAEWAPEPVRVTWPFGYGVETRDGGLALTRLGQVVAREGETVSAGGGFTANDERFIACGPVAPRLLLPPEDEATP